MKIPRLLWIPALAVLAGCATASVSADYDKAADFEAYRTFAWGEAQKPTGDLRFDDPDLRRAVKDAVSVQLTSKGMAPGDARTCDILLKDYITVEMKEDRMAEYPMTYPPVFDPRVGVTNLPAYAAREAFMFKYEEGTFVLDMIERASGKIVWRGSLEGMVDPAASQAKRIERVPSAAAKVLAKYPPVSFSKRD